MYRDVLAIVLAGGRGSRLEPLTRDRAKPAVPFGGIYRIIDFTLSNCINSDIRKILVLTQYKATSLNRHLDQGWRFLSRELNEYIEVIPPQQRIAEMWYQGTADAIYQQAVEFKENGTVPAIEVLRAQVELQAQQQRLIYFRNEFAKQKLNLERATGIPDGQPLRLTDGVPFAPMPSLTLEGAVARALAERRDYQSLAASLRGSELAREATGAERA